MATGSTTAKTGVTVKYRRIRQEELILDKRDKFFERGQFGDVKRAKWNNQEVAVKYFTLADRKGGFNEELRNLSVLQGHPHIVKMHGACVSDHPFIVLEFAPLSLEKVIHECKKDYHYISDHVISWSYQASVGLDYIHKKELLHRDIKPSNVLLFDKGKVLKLCDFGTAKKLEHTLTNAVGTIRYMAPEVIRGRYYTDRCDVFSFGMMVWEMLARKRPMLLGTSRGNNMAILYAMANGERPPKLSNTPRAMAEMIYHCWDEEPHRRPTMSEIKLKLEHLCKFVEMDKPLIHRRKRKPAGAEGKSEQQDQAAQAKADHVSEDTSSSSSKGQSLASSIDQASMEAQPSMQSAASLSSERHSSELGGKPLEPPELLGQPSELGGQPTELGGQPSELGGQPLPSELRGQPSELMGQPSELGVHQASEMGGQPSQFGGGQPAHFGGQSSESRGQTSSRIYPPDYTIQSGPEVGYPLPVGGRYQQPPGGNTVNAERPPIHQQPSIAAAERNMSTLQLRDQPRHRANTSPVRQISPDPVRKQISTPTTSSRSPAHNHTLTDAYFHNTLPRSSPPSHYQPRIHSFQTRFPKAVVFPHYIPGLDKDLQPILPNESNPESVEQCRQYKLIAEEVVASISQQNRLRDEASNLDREIRDDEVRMKSKQGVTKDYQDKANEQEKLVKELDALKKTYNMLRMGNP